MPLKSKHKSLLGLEIQQLERASHKIIRNRYGDQRLVTYHDEIRKLIESLNKGIANNHTYPPTAFNHAVSLCFDSIGLLGHSTLNTIPFELVECIKTVLSTWLQTINEKYIIVTRLNDQYRNAHFEPNLAFNENLYVTIENIFEVKFERRLIVIGLPRYLAHDYLFGVVVYHELGHFIDFKYTVSEKAAAEIWQGCILGNEALLQLYLAITSRVFMNDQNSYYMLLNHLREYFADIFSAQYIGIASVEYVLYLNSESPNEGSYTHPPTNKRYRQVESFLQRRLNPIQEILDRYLKRSTYETLGAAIGFEIRHKPINKLNFENLIPLEVSSESELHGIFPYAWQLWMSEESSFAKNWGVKRYQILNHLIEKSISNYFIVNKWNDHVS